MTDTRQTPDDLAEVRRCFETYGSDLKRWPAPMRVRLAPIAAGEALADARKSAEALDALLREATEPQTPHDLKNRIEAGYYPQTDKQSTHQSLWAGLSTLAGWLRPAPLGAMASLGVIGFVAGAILNATGTRAPEAEAYAFLEDSGYVDFDYDTEASWDAE